MKLTAILLTFAMLGVVTYLFSATTEAPTGPALQRDQRGAPAEGGTDLANVADGATPRSSSVPTEPASEARSGEAEAQAPVPVEEPRPGDLAQGLLVRVEDASERGIAEAMVTLHWRAGDYDYREFKGVTDSRGQLVTPLLSAFQVESIGVRPKGVAFAYENASIDTVADLREPGLLRFALPDVRQIQLHALDEKGQDLKNVAIKIEGKKTLPLEAGVNQLKHDRDVAVETDATGRRELNLDVGAYVASVESAPRFSGVSSRFGVRPGTGTESIKLTFETPGPVEPPQSEASLVQIVESAPERVLTGTVVDALTGKAISPAVLHFTNHLPRHGSGGGVRTDTTGWFRAVDSRQPPRRYLHCSARGYAWSAWDLEGGSPTDSITITMEPETEIRGLVVNGSGAPVQGRAHLFLPAARVLSLSASANAVGNGSYRESSEQACETGPQGQISFSKLTRGLHRIWFQPEDTSLPPVECFAKGGDRTLVITVGEEPDGLGTLNGTLVNGFTDDPVPNLEFILSGSHTPLTVKSKSDQDGAFTIRGLAPGAFEYRIRHLPETAGMTPFAFASGSVEVSIGEQQKTFRPYPARKLQLHLISSSPSAVPRDAAVAAFEMDGKRIELQDDAGYEEGRFDRTDWNGRVNLLGLPAQDVEIRIWLNEDDHRAEKVADATHRINLAEPRPEIIRLQVDP